MSARAIVSGALHKAAEARTSKAGKRFATFKLRENVNSSTRWWSAIAFDEAAIAAVLSMEIGEPIAIAGEIDYQSRERGDERRLNWPIVVDAVLTARRPARKAKRETPKPNETSGRDRAGSSWASPPASAGDVPANDYVPFALGWR